MLFVISGPSGVGKGTVINQLLSNHKNLGLVVSATTRSPRENEVDGLNYYFMSDSQFNNHIKSNHFLEWCNVHGNKYGTLESEISKKSTCFDALIIEIDVQGAKKLRRHSVAQHHIFLAPPSIAILEDRLSQRGTEKNDALANRLKNANDEINQQHLFDTGVGNKELTQTISQLDNVILTIMAKGA